MGMEGRELAGLLDMKVLIISLMVLCLFGPAVLSETYKWAEEDGTVNLSDDPSSIPEKYQDQIKVDPSIPIERDEQNRSLEKNRQKELPQSTWTKLTDGTPSTGMNAVIWSGSKFVAVGHAGTISTSSDGVSWSTQSLANVNNLYGVTWGGGQFIAVGVQGTILRSFDGQSWTEPSSGTTEDLVNVIWNGSKYVAVGSTVLTSTNGIFWKEQSGIGVNKFRGINWNGTQFIGVSGTSIFSSTNAITWKTINISDANISLQEVEWNGSLYVAAGGSFLTSSDGFTWTIQLSEIDIFPDKTSVRDIVTIVYISWDGSRFLAVGNKGTILTSDGWSNLVNNSINDQSFNDAVWDGKKFIAVGSTGIFSISGDAIPTSTVGGK